MNDLHKIAFYPVGNGDTTQIILSAGRRILFDFCHRRNGEDKETPEIDLKKRLQDELRDADREYFDVVAFTHADLDHIQGSTEFFELKYAEKYQGNSRIKIKQLWVPAAMLLEEATLDQQSDEFVILRQESRYRLLEGEDILVFSRPQKLMDWLVPKLKERGLPANARDHLFVDAGRLVDGFTLESDGAEFFCHSPFIKHCDEGDIVRNDAALVFNVRLTSSGSSYDYLHIGDATWEVLEEIVSTTRRHGNEDRLDWNLFNIPHHCSYLALSDEKGETETTPKPLVKDLLLMGRSDAYVVSCSCPIPESKDAYNQTQPPHIQARKAYKKYLEEIGGRKVLVTMEEPNATYPEPIIFDVASTGVTPRRSESIGAAAIIVSRAPRAG
jgi:hypothetical protein